MNKRHIHAGELYGIVLLMCVAIDLIVGLWVKSEILHIHPLWVSPWISGLSISIGIIVLVFGCIAGYVSHEAFNQATSPDGETRYLLKKGLFKLVRHPFYLSLILIALSFVLVFRSYLLLFGLLLAIVHFLREARKEEKYLLKTFGDEYISY